MTDSTTSPASGDVVVDNPELQRLEQAVKAEAVDTPDTNEEQQVEDAPSEEKSAFDLLAEKKGFKDADDLAQAYQNLESFQTKTSQELREIRNEIKQSNAPQPEDPYANLPAEQQQALGLLRKVVEDVVDAKVQPLREDVEVRRASSQLDAIRQDPNFKGVTDETLNSAMDLMEGNRTLSLEHAVKIANYDNARQESLVAQKKTAKTQEKKRAFVESSKTAKTGDIDYSKLSLEELESILPHDGQYVDSKGVLRR